MANLRHCAVMCECTQIKEQLKFYISKSLTAQVVQERFTHFGVENRTNTGDGLIVETSP
jgi:hypothetical protein